MNTPLDPAVEYRFKLLEKDIEVLQLKQKELDTYIKATTELGFKMQNLEGKLDEFGDKFQKLGEQTTSNSKGAWDVNNNLVKVIGVVLSLLAGGLGVKIWTGAPDAKTSMYQPVPSISSVYQEGNG